MNCDFVNFSTQMGGGGNVKKSRKATLRLRISADEAKGAGGRRQGKDQNVKESYLPNL